MAESILRITDGTTTISLLEIPGLLLESWTPSIPTYKGGGTYQSSPLSTGRQLVNKQFENVIETFSFKIEDVNSNSLIQRMQEIRRLLEKASSFWAADWQNEPVWIEARAKCEDNIRYGLIVTGLIPDDDNPYEQPFGQYDGDESVMDNMTLIIEHHIWTATEPGTKTAVSISASETYDGRNLGNVDSAGTEVSTTETNTVFIANRRNEANLSDVYVDNGGVWSANLMDAILPFNLLPAVPAVNDALYLGIESALANSGAFESAIFDIGTAGAGYNGTWEYFNGAWVALTVQDNTNDDGQGLNDPFDTTDIKSVHWSAPSDWALRNLIADGGPAITGYFVRMRVTAIPGALTAPTQQNRDIYAVIWPYVEIQSDQVAGDIISFSRIRARNQSDNNESAALTAWSNRVIIGLRSVDRGPNFTAYLNFADRQNPTNVTASNPGGFTNDVQAPAFRISQFVPLVVRQAWASITIDSPLSEEYHGAYHGFLRGQQTVGSLGDFTLAVIGRIGFGGPTIFFDSGFFSFQFANDWQIIDLGKIVIPSVQGGTLAESLRFDVDGIGDGVATAWLYDLILIPVDEWAVECLDTVNSIRSRLGARGSSGVATGNFSNYLDIDPITDPKKPSYLIKRISTDEFKTSYLGISPDKALLQANKRQKLWFTFMRFPSVSTTEQRSEPWIAYTSIVNKQQQYLSMRGDR